MLGPFSEDDRIFDPRGLSVDWDLLFLNSGSERFLALDGKRVVVRDSGPIAGLNPGGGNFEIRAGLHSAGTAAGEKVQTVAVDSVLVTTGTPAVIDTVA